MEKKPQAKVRYGRGITVTRNYQSFRCDAEVSLDCAQEDILPTFDKAKKLVEAQLKSEKRKAHSYLNEY